MSEATEPSKYQQFVDFIIKVIDKKNGTAAAAKLKRANNPNLEYQSWEYLAHFTDIEKDYKRLPYATIACAMANAKVEKNGTTKIGEAIAKCYKDGNEDDQAKAKLRRLLACESIEEVCRVLRSLFSLIQAKTAVELDYVDLLKDLVFFQVNSQDKKLKWAKNFYYHPIDRNEGEND